MHVTIDPVWPDWRPAFTTGAERAALAPLVSGAGSASGPPTLSRVIATGHQAWLWHPGILAKNVAAVHAARRFEATALHVVVDQDAHASLDLDLPVLRDGRLEVASLPLAPADANVPTGSQGPADTGHVLQTLGSARERLGPALAVDLQPLMDAYGAAPPAATLAGQTAAVLGHLMPPGAGPLHLLFATDLARLPWMQRAIARMLEDPGACATTYNDAVGRHPEAGVAPLRRTGALVELPLWSLPWGRPRRRVFAPTDRHTPRLVGPEGEALDAEARLAPRALLLTAVMRAFCCDLFIHGRGGAIYDRVVEAWWPRWFGGQLAPRTTVSADVRLDFDAPVCDRHERDAAVAWRHHLPHNLDRALDLDLEAARRKRDLLAHMDDDRDRRRRAASFQEIHAVNRALAAAHPEAIRAADRRLAEARNGLANHHIALRRDWCFALYPQDDLLALARHFP